MVTANQFKKLLYEHEVLWARYDIRDHYLKNITQVVYENIGQVLSLVRLQLSLLLHENSFSDAGSVKESATGPYNLIGKAIVDLRTMCRSFDPEMEYLVKLGFLQALENELKLLDIDEVRHVIEVKGEPTPLINGTELIVFRMLQEILYYIGKEYKKKPIRVEAIYKKNNVIFTIRYDGDLIEWNKFYYKENAGSPFSRLNLSERAELINAKLVTVQSLSSSVQVKLTVPFKITKYE